jgi:AcrR family transcriptional regulator
MEVRPRGRKKELRGDIRQREITSALVALLDEGQRLAEISIGDITKRAGITRAAFYYFFESKERVMLAALGDLAEELNEADLVFTAGTSEDPRSELLLALSALARIRRNEHHLMRAFSEAAANDPEVWGALERLVEASAARVAARIVKLRAQRGSSTSERSAFTIARNLVWMNERNFYRLSIGPSPKAEWDEVVQGLVTIWHAAVVGVEEAPARKRRA